MKGHIVTRKNQANQLSANPLLTAKSAKNDSSDSKANSSGSKSRGKKKNDSLYSGPGPCTHCKGKYHDVSTCMQKKNEDLGQKMDALIKQMASGKANLACDSDSNSDWLDSIARLATASTLSAVNVAKRLNIDLGTSDTLVPPSIHLNDKSGSSLVIQMADNSKIRATSCGKLPLLIANFPPLRAHSVPGLAKPLLSVSDVTDQDIAVTFLKGSVLFTKHQSRIDTFLRDSGDIIAE